jgi:hypothetical protein
VPVRRSSERIVTKPALLGALALVSACGGGAGTAATDAGAAAAAGLCPLRAFSPCGGDIEGTWRMVELCDLGDQAASRPRMCDGPGSNLPACQGGSNARTCRAVYRVTAEIGPSTMVLRTALLGSSRYTFDDACLMAVGGGATAPDACAALARPAAGLACTYQSGQCTCEGTTTEALQSGVDTYPYVRDGARITLRPGAGMSTGAYCVSGDRLAVQFDMVGSQGWRSWILER